jgi:tetratricopeptide (TPR) repeat protein
MARIAPSVLLTLAAALPSVALAGSPFDKVLAGADSVELSGPVDVPLYSAPWGGSSVGVFMNVGEDRFFVQVLPGASSLFLSAGAAGKLGTKVKSKDINNTEYSYTDLDEVKLGDVVLRDVRVLTTENEISNLSDAVREATPEGVGFDGHIGLGALTDKLAWALLLDEGVLRLAPAGQGAALVSAVGGKTLKTRSLPSTRIKFGKENLWSLPDALVAKVDIAGNPTEAVLSWALRTSMLDSSLALPEGAPTSTKGDRVFAWSEAGPEGAIDATWVSHTSSFNYFTTNDGPLVPYKGMLGRRVLEELNVAYDPGTGDLGYKRADKPTRKDPLPELLADAQAALDESLKPAEDAAEDAEAPTGDKGAWKRLAEVKEDMGDFAGSIAALTKITEIDEDACDAWRDLGNVQRITGDLEGAKASLETSAGLFDAWWAEDIPLSPKFQALTEREIELSNRKHLAAKSRTEWSELVAKAEKKEIEPTELGVPEGLKPQAGAACGSVRANLASVHMLLGESDKVAAMYAARSDWDKELPLVAGNSALVSGDLDAAGAAYRQNSKANLDHEASSRFGLAVVAAKQGRWDDGRKLMASANEWTQDNSELRAWLTLRAEKDGAVGAAKEAAQLSNAQPSNAASAVSWAEWAKAADDAGRVKEATARAQALTAARLRHDKNDEYAIALNARLSLLAGDVAAAKKGAERAIKLAPASAMAHATMAAVHAAEGDQAKADAASLRAASVSPRNPAYATGIKK